MKDGIPEETKQSRQEKLRRNKMKHASAGKVPRKVILKTPINPDAAMPCCDGVLVLVHNVTEEFLAGSSLVDPAAESRREPIYHWFYGAVFLPDGQIRRERLTFKHIPVGPISVELLLLNLSAPNRHAQSAFPFVIVAFLAASEPCSTLAGNNLRRPPLQNVRKELLDISLLSALACATWYPVGSTHKTQRKPVSREACTHR